MFHNHFVCAVSAKPYPILRFKGNKIIPALLFFCAFLLLVVRQTYAQDATPPTVTQTSPAGNEAGVGVNRAITATFSELMNANTITMATFSVTDGVASVAGTLSYLDTTVTFTPSNDLPYSTRYTATITTGVTDLAGNALSSNYTWSFTTSIASPEGLQAYYTFDEGNGTVVNDSSGNGNNGTITGATWTTGKSGGGLSFDGNNDSVTVPRMNNDEVSVCAWFYKNANDTTRHDAIFSGLRASLNTQLREGFELRFPASAPDRIEFVLVTQDGSGNKSTRIAQGDLVHSVGNWYHVAGTYNKTSGEQKLYVNGGLVHTLLHGAGNTIVPLTLYSDMRIGYSRVNNGYFRGAVDEVRLYSRALTNQEILDLFNSPTVSTTSPAENEAGVAVNSAITATFSEPMDANTITTATFTPTDGVTPVTGTVSYTGTTATFMPSGNLSYATNYTATITTGATDLSGDALTSAYTWSFTTGAAPPQGLLAYYTFNEGSGTVINDSSGNGNTGAINEAAWTTGRSAGGLSFDGLNDYVYLGNPLSLQPGAVSVSAWFKTTDSNGIIIRKRSYGYGLDVWNSGRISFWIYNSAATLFRASSLLAYHDNLWHHAVGVYDGSTVRLYIDGAQVASAPAGTIFYGAGGIAIGRDGDSSGSYYSGLIDGVSIYNRALSNQGVSDLFHNPGLFDTIPPVVSSTSPARDATGVALNSAITVTFNEAMNASTINTSTFTVSNGVSDIEGTVSYRGETATFTPSSNLTYATSYTARITGGVRDAGGNALTGNYSWSFIAGAPDTTAPAVNSTRPVSTATTVAVNSAITVIFSEVMDAATINASTFTVRNESTSSEISGTVSYSGVIATFTPSSSLAYATPYTATITTGARDAAGNAMAANYAWSFTAVSAQEEMIPDWTNVVYSPFHLVPPTTVTNPVQKGSDVTEYPADMVADTFLFYENNTWYMFNETLGSGHNGDLAVSLSSDGLHWTYQQIVLNEPFHLSYPQVFKFGGTYYMIPETSAVNEMRLYRATNFPSAWTREATLLSGSAFVDSSIFRHNGKWWIFTGNATISNCYLYYSDNLTSGWIQHPMSPIVTGDSNKTRPAGRAFVYDNNRIIRTAQNGEFVRVFEVDTLTTTQYAEHEIPESPILNKSGSGWNATGMHHFDPWWTGNHWLCSVDGRSGDFHSWSAGIYLSPHPSSPDGIINSPIDADVTIDKGDSVLFSGTGSDLGGNLPLSYRWKFSADSGIPDSLQKDPGLTQFNIAGTFTVTLTITDAVGIYDPTPAVRTISVLDTTH
ncbi:MAG: hypothetical protein DCC43_07945 [Candidatus Brocadia sp.]|nr:hypothetical protein [Candidatus Brocadia fulgida]MCC6324149.1 Ig-like domain-containing protein [Candidatus Brocadia sp.]MCE7912070.1 hypothetical protein [Candidatus Brocadia sp. AMX3]MDG5997479.1 hypothetical protein [Candidatus Brocadia sp.]RIJ99819.1 MAG: hypothetical protein DCC43_07945 [Candidatus Brocadia sp.]